MRIEDVLAPSLGSFIIISGCGNIKYDGRTAFDVRRASLMTASRLQQFSWESRHIKTHYYALVQDYFYIPLYNLKPFFFFWVSAV